jgi:hypothetical protein
MGEYRKQPFCRQTESYITRGSTEVAAFIYIYIYMYVYIYISPSPGQLIFFRVQDLIRATVCLSVCKPLYIFHAYMTVRQALVSAVQGDSSFMNFKNNE